MTTPTQMKRLYSRLSEHGLPKRYVRSLLPDWWEDCAADSPEAFTELKMQLSRVLGLDFRALMDDDPVVRFKPLERCSFKKQEGTSDERVGRVRAIATSAARIAADACEIPDSHQDLRSAGQLRASILSEGYDCVSFEALLDCLWRSGIPVLYLSHLPQGVPKMDGMAVPVSGRPVIVLSNGHKKAAWHLFILAHEVGHIMAGHLQEGGSIFDLKVDDEEKEDPEEKEANSAAIELLNGEADTAWHSRGRWVNGETLAEAACEKGKENAIDPGHIVLNYARTQKDKFGVPDTAAWGAAQRALRKLGDPDGQAMMCDRIVCNLNPEAVSDDSFEFLLKITGAE